MSRLLEGKVALVTGAGHGIGRGHALELAKHGAAVVVNDLGTSVRGEGQGRDAEHVVGLITASGGTAVADFGDVGDEDQAAAMVERAYEQFGQLDILVNNAGIVRDRAIWNMPAEDYDLVMRIHVRGTWLTSRAAARHWRDRAKAEGGTVYGRIINTTSGAGLLGNFGQTNYATAKAAIVGLTLTLNLELASIGVTANVIGPAGVTRLSATVPGMPEPVEVDERSPEDFDPLDPSLCCPIVAWLACPEADHVSGQVIRVRSGDIILMGGWTEDVTVRCNSTRWDASTLGQVFSTKVFRTRGPGLDLWS
jgi:NAD(P)-dependent dehydrogenase (short-subunit alcohol dehydrogenase family)